MYAWANTNNFGVIRNIRRYTMKCDHSGLYDLFGTCWHTFCSFGPLPLFSHRETLLGAKKNSSFTCLFSWIEFGWISSAILKRNSINFKTVFHIFDVQQQAKSFWNLPFSVSQSSFRFGITISVAGTYLTDFIIPWISNAYLFLIW